jgi:hypothetical protein
MQEQRYGHDSHSRIDNILLERTLDDDEEEEDNDEDNNDVVMIMMMMIIRDIEVAQTRRGRSPWTTPCRDCFLFDMVLDTRYKHYE